MTLLEKKVGDLPYRLIVMGVSGCGKSKVGSLLAARLGITHFEGDNDHPPANIQKMAAGSPLNDEDRHGWLLALQERLRLAKEHGDALVLSCSALKRKYRDILRAGDKDVVFIHLDGDREIISARMQARADHFMPVALLDSQLRDLEPPQDDELAVRLDISTPPEELVEQVIEHFQLHKKGDTSCAA